MIDAWGPGSYVFQWGPFSSTEIERVRSYCQKYLRALPFLDPEKPMESLFYGRMGGAGLNMVHLCMHTIATMIDPGVRFVCFFAKAEDRDLCNASAHELPANIAENAYAIEFNFEGLAVMGDTIERFLSKIDDRTLDELPGGTLVIATEQCLIVAVTFVFYHELGHVLRKHFALLNGDRHLRRALETDADELSGQFLNILVDVYGKSQWGIERTEASRWLAALIGAYAVFATLGEGGALSNGNYHLPTTRLLWVSQFLKLKGVKDATVRLLPHLMIYNFDLAPPDDRANRADLKELGEVTLPLLSELRASGKLKGWFK